MSSVTSGITSGRLAARADEIAAALLAHDFTEVPEPERSRLRQCYVDVVPVVIHEALAAVDQGVPVTADCLARVREMAARRCDDDFSPGAALRGALPALRVLTAVLRGSGTGGGVADRVATIELMHHAGLVAHQLGAAWVEGWLESIGGHRRTDAAEGAAPTAPLEPHVQHMIELVAEGRSNAEIATATHYSRQAVSWQLSRIMKAWHSPNRAALVAKAFARGILTVRPPRHRDVRE